MHQHDLLTPSSLTKRIGNYLVLLDRVLGSGHYGTVYLAFKILSSGKDQREYSSIILDMEKPFACKILERDELGNEASRLVENELKNLRIIRSPNVIKLVKHFRTHQRIYILTEACNGGDLEQFLKLRGGRLDECETRLIMSQLMRGMRDLHDLRIIHRDIKLSNILIDFKSDRAN